MGFQWSMATEDVDDEDAVNSWLRMDFEPFAVDEGTIYLKRHVFSEDDEPKSSTKPENEVRSAPE